MHIDPFITLLFLIVIGFQIANARLIRKHTTNGITTSTEYDRGRVYVYDQHFIHGRYLEDIMSLTDQNEWEDEPDTEFIRGVREGIEIWTHRNINHRILKIGDTNA